MDLRLQARKDSFSSLKTIDPNMWTKLKLDIWLAVCYSKDLILLNCGVGENSLESLGLQGDPTSSL